VIRGIEGASRMSSVFGLKVKPNTATDLAAQHAGKRGRHFPRHGALAVIV
jgi:hypothetical protein